jgi:ribosomal protein S12 methylthiotransferase accessory factor
MSISSVRPAALDEVVPKRLRDGTHRAATLGETLARMGALMPAMGITRLANITGLDRIGLPVVVSVRPNARSLSVAQGKGLSLGAAKASALMESIEGYHGERVALPLRLASYDELRACHRVVDLDGLPRQESSVFHPHLRMLWVEGYDLLQDALVWLPLETVHTDFTLPAPPGHGSFAQSSNGLASGNHLLEALSHALCELIERDAVALWQELPAAGQAATRVDLDSIDEPNCFRVLELFERAGVVAAVWEATSDCGLPVFTCSIAERAIDPLHPVPATAGYGCHPNRGIALLRALTEAAQSRLTVIAGSRDDLFHDDFDLAQSPDSLGRERALLEPAGAMRRFADAPAYDGETLNDDVGWELKQLQAIGVRSAVLVDLTLPALGVPVARVVVPGLDGPSVFSSGIVPGPRTRDGRGAARGTGRGADR